MKKLLHLFLLFSCCSAFAALPNTSVLEVRLAGLDTNGGGFSTGASGTDMSQFNQMNGSACTTAGTTCYSKTADLSTTDAVAVGTGVITSATATFGTEILGNIIYLAGGTGTLTGGWYYVSVRTSSSSITVDRNVAAGTGITMNIGGALLSPGQASAIMTVSGMTAFILNVGADGASVYSITSATGNVSGGTISPSIVSFFQGYTSNRTLGNTDARPTIKSNVSTATVISSSTVVLQNIIFDGNSQTAAKFTSNAPYGVGLLITNFNTISVNGPNCYRCSATTNSAGVFAGSICIACEAYANTATPFIGSNCVECISSGNTGATTEGFSSAVVVCYHCIGVSNGQDGMNAISSAANLIIDSHMESNARYGFDLGYGKTLINDSYYNNGTAGIFNSIGSIVGSIPVTSGSVFVAAGSNNYALNSAAGEGALLENAADPALFPRGLTANYRDVGSAQHQASSGGQTGFVY